MEHVFHHVEKELSKSHQLQHLECVNYVHFNVQVVLISTNVLCVLLDISYGTINVGENVHQLLFTFLVMEMTIVKSVYHHA